MVNPIGPIDESQAAIPADLSALGMAASEASRSQEAQGIASGGGAEKSKPSTDAIQEFRMVGGARRSLASLMDKVTQLFSPSKSSSPSVQTFAEAQKLMEAAKTQMQNASTVEALKTGWQDFQHAVKEMERLADPTQMQSVNVLKAEIADKQGTIDQILELGAELDSLNQLYQDLLSTSSLDVIKEIRGKIEDSRQRVNQLLKDLSASGVQSPIIDDAATRIEAKQEELLALANGLQQVYDAGKESLAALESAQKNNSKANIANSKQVIAEAQKVLEAIAAIAPNSPIVKAAKKEIAKAAKGIDQVVPSGGLVSSSGAASVASSQNQGKNISEKRLALLSDSADNDSLALILNGFRSMIQHFRTQSNEAQEESGDVSREVEGELEGLKAENPGASSELQGLEDALFSSDESAQADFSNALSSIASASVKLGGGSSAQATQTGSDVKQLYTSSSGPALRNSSSLRAGYRSWKSLNNTYASVNGGVRDVLNQAMNPALSTPLPRGESSSHGDAAHDVAQAAISHSRTLGDLYQALQIVEQGGELVSKNGGNVPHDFRSKLTELVSGPPQFGYPYMQLPPQEAQQFMQKLEEAFVRGSRELAEKKEAEFVSNPQFIQQVLTNVASLFAAYLQN